MEKNKLIIYTASSRAVNRAHDVLFILSIILISGGVLTLIGNLIALANFRESSGAWVVGGSLVFAGLAMLLLAAYFHGLWSLVRASEIYAADMMERYDVRDDKERERTNNESEAKKEDGK